VQGPLVFPFPSAYPLLNASPAVLLFLPECGDLLDDVWLDDASCRCCSAPCVRASAVNSFGYTDHYLDSALGRFDGNVYQDLFQRAMADPINASP